VQFGELQYLWALLRISEGGEICPEEMVRALLDRGQELVEEWVWEEGVGVVGWEVTGREPEEGESAYAPVVGRGFLME